MSHALAESKVNHTPSVKLHIRADFDLDKQERLAEGKVYYADLWLSVGAVDRTAETLRNLGYTGDDFEELNGTCLEGYECEFTTKWEEFNGKSYEKVNYVNPVGHYATRGIKPVADGIAKSISRKYSAALKKFKPKEGVRASGKPSPAPKAATMQPSSEAQSLENELNSPPF
jgi:hypothetical protein